MKRPEHLSADYDARHVITTAPAAATVSGRMAHPLFVELTTGQTAVHVSIRARVEAAALCSELQSALRALTRDTKALAYQVGVAFPQSVDTAEAALARAKGTAA